MIYGNSEDRNISKFIRLVMKYRIVPLPGGGKSIFQPVHVDDLAACILAALKTPASVGKSYNVPGGSAHSLREIVEIISGILGRKVLVVPVPLGLAEAAAGAGEAPPPPLHPPRADRAAARGQAIRLLGGREGSRLRAERAEGRHRAGDPRNVRACERRTDARSSHR